jgi:hypothetical protein
MNISDEGHNMLLDLNIKSREVIKNDKVLCIWRDRFYNVCEKNYIKRDKVRQFVQEYPDIFDWVEATLNEEDFYKLLVSYKYVLCPVGNGVDPSPKSFEAIATNTIPIIIRTINTRDVYSDLPCIMVDDFKDVITPGFLDTHYNEKKHMLYNFYTIMKLSAIWWAYKIKSGL